MVRKYINGTRSRHGKITSIMMEEESKGPDERGTWTIEGSYSTEAGGKEQFTASVTSRGEVLLTTDPGTQDTSGKRPLKSAERKSKSSFKRNETT